MIDLSLVLLVLIKTDFFIIFVRIDCEIRVFSNDHFHELAFANLVILNSLIALLSIRLLQ